MKLFIRRLLYFLAIQIAVLAVIILAVSRAPVSNFASAIEKHERAGATPSPRVLVSGGSNAAFSFDSALLERELGRPVVNMGVQIGYGPYFLLRQLRAELRPGDAALLSLEYEHFYNNTVQGAIVLRTLTESPRLIRFWGPEYILPILEDGLSGIGAIARSPIRTWLIPPTHPHRRDSFTERGDVDPKYRRTSLPPADWAPPGSVDPDAPLRRAVIRAMADFARACEQDSIQVFFSFPPQPADTFADRQSIADEVLRALQRETTAILLGQPADTAYPRELFYDSDYHLTDAGSTRRMRFIAERMRPQLR